MSFADEIGFGLDDLHSSSYLRVEADCKTNSDPVTGLVWPRGWVKV